MKIASTQYTLSNKSLDIYISGCSGPIHCTNCHNKELWNFDVGDQYDKTFFEKIKNKVNEFNFMIDNIMIFGGEPNDQNKDELYLFLKDLKSLNKKIWLFTRYELNEIPKFELEICDYIKTGRYVPELCCEKNEYFGINLATSNQKILDCKTL